MKHKLGPWTYTRNPENTRFIIDSEPAHAIACTAGFEPNNEANARLIAAAPELLEALQLLLQASEKEFKRTGFPVSFLSGINGGAVEKARSAIAKALGEA